MDLTNGRWWVEGVKSPQVAAAVDAILSALKPDADARTEALARSYRLYGSFNARSIRGYGYTRPDSARVMNRLSINVTASCIDTAVAKLGKNRIRPRFLTSGGSWSQRQRAKMLGKFNDGIFYQTGFYKTQRACLRDSTVWDCGVATVFEDEDGRIAIERVLPEEIVVDGLEARMGSPRSMYRKRAVSREMLLAMFEGNDDATKKIKDAKAETHGGNAAAAGNADQITIVEGWHLPSGKIPEITDEQRAELDELKDEKDDQPSERWEKREQRDEIWRHGHDGRHVIAIEGGQGILVFEAWRKKYFPFVFTYWQAPMLGLFGQSLAMQLFAIQYEINKTVRIIQACLPWSVARVFVNTATKVATSHIDDTPGAMVKYSGEKPTIEGANAVSPDLFQHLVWLIQQAYEITGISQLSAQAKKPPGIESGRGIREMSDIESERFYTVGVQLEEFTLECSRQAINLAREIHERDGEYVVRAPDAVRKSVMNEIAWEDVDLDNDAFIMQVFPTSTLPSTPAGKLEVVNDYIQLGFLDREDGIRLLSLPDTEAWSDLNDATAEFTSWQMEQMVEHGKPQTPRTYQNLTYAMKHAASTLMMIEQMDDVEDERIDLVRNYVAQAKKFMDDATAASMPPAPMAPAAVPPPPPMSMPAPAPPM